MNEGKLRRRLRLPPDTHARERQQREFLDLYRSGAPAKKIAAALGVTTGAVYTEAHQLRHAGLLASRYRERKHPRHPRPSPLASRTHPRVVTIVEMTKARATLKEIGEALGKLSGERARQLRAKIKALHGEKIFGPREEILTLREVAKKSGVSESTARDCAKAAGLLSAARKRGYHYRFTRPQTEALRALLSPRLGTGRCAVCARSFRPKQKRHILCRSPECRARRQRQRHAALLAAPPSAETLGGWYRPLWQALKKHPILPEEKWMGQTAAIALSGLSLMQLSWLKLRRILTTRESSTRRWRGNGKPCREYARSQLLLAKRVREEEQRRPRKDSP